MLQVLVDYVATQIPHDRFKYDVVLGSDWKGKLDLSCGTVGCILGWGMTCEILQKAGLITNLEKYTITIGDEVYDDVFSAGAELFRGAQKLFRLTSREMDYLFQPDSYENSGNRLNPLDNDAKLPEVVKHIREFLANGGAPPSEDDDDNFADEQERSELYGV
jgi:hypothetical protein